jgi:hypothetical protein
MTSGQSSSRLRASNFCEQLAPFFPISESTNLLGTRSTVHVSPTTNDCDLLQTLAFESSFHTALLFLPEYLSSEIRGSPPHVLLDPTVQIHFALRNFAKTSLFLLANLPELYLPDSLIFLHLPPDHQHSGSTLGFRALVILHSTQLKTPGGRFLWTSRSLATYPFGRWMVPLGFGTSGLHYLVLLSMSGLWSDGPDLSSYSDLSVVVTPPLKLWLPPEVGKNV